MYWKTKAKIQKLISLLPNRIGELSYFYLQRNFGALRNYSPVSRIESANQVNEFISNHNMSLIGKHILEVGTGRVPIAAICYWLLGASKIVTVDLNRYLSKSLLLQSLKYMTDNPKEVIKILGYKVDLDRLNILQKIDTKKMSVSEILERLGIIYLAPSDASDININSGHFDFHVSYTVLEHIDPVSLNSILKEGKRILSPRGLMVHRIDYSDHFSHSDKSISAINFLRYSDHQWNMIAGNKFMYMNRLRHDDYLELFKTAGLQMMQQQETLDEHIIQDIKNSSIQLNDRFSQKSPNILGITGCWFVMR